MKRELMNMMPAGCSLLLLAACGPAGKSPAGVIATPAEIRQAVSDSRAPLTLVHVWATWCDPCREEFPDLLEVYRDLQNQGLSLLLVSADDPGELEAVNTFLRENGSPVGSLVSTELNQNFIELFSSNWPGALPASFFFDADGNLVEEWQGKHSYAEYAETIERLLKP